MRRPLTQLLFATTALLAVVPTAQAAERWASNSGTGTTCLSSAPCSLSTAVSGANPGDDVVLTSGSYPVGTGLTVDKAITFRGEPGQPRPVLTGTATVLSIDAAATVRHLRIEATSSSADALSVKGGPLVEDLEVIAVSDAVKVVTDGATVVRDSVFVSNGAGTRAIKVASGPQVGSAALRNVIAWTVQSSAIGIECLLTTGSATIVNSVARGGAGDVYVKPGADCTAAYSNIRNGISVDNGQTAAPLFVNELGFDFRPLAGSPTRNAGTATGANGTIADPAGVARTTGGSPDIGVYEYDEQAPVTPDPPDEEPVDGGAGAPPPGDETPTDGDDTPPVDETPTDETPDDTTATKPPAGEQDKGTPSKPAAVKTPVVPAPVAEPRADVPPAPPLPEVAAPQLGRSITLDAGKGSVKVKLPGGKGFVDLSDAASLPVGTVVDTRRGEVTLTTALPGGRTQTGTFGGGQFEIRQPKNARGLTDIVLRGGSFAGCPARKPRAKRAVAVAAAKSKTVRKLWAKDKGGRFRTHGRTTVATVRGTRWLTEDRCDGTLTRVTEGAVDVKDRRTGKTTRVRAGKSLLVAPR